MTTISQEWTVISGTDDTGIRLGNKSKLYVGECSATKIVDAHNAALAADHEKALEYVAGLENQLVTERQRTQHVGEQLDSYVLTVTRLERELATERQRREQAEQDCVKWQRQAFDSRGQLLSAQAAIEKQQELLNVAHCPNCNGQGWTVTANHNTGEPEQEQCQWCFERKLPVDLSLLHEHDAAKQADIDEARAQRDWLIQECARVGVTVNVQIGAPVTEAYRLVNNNAKVRKLLVELIDECREAVAYLSDKVPYDEMVTPTRHTTSSLCKAIDDALAKNK